jgi:general secretion pathway protein J
MRTKRGFTLIELLVSMAIVAIIGVLALTGLNTVISQQEITAARAERWREIQLAMRMLVQDLSQVHPRTTRDETGTYQLPSFLADPSHQFALEFSRGGWSNPTGFPRGSVLRVAYDIEDDVLVRFYWPVADRTMSTPPGRNELLTGVTELLFEYFDESTDWTIEWPPLDNRGISAIGPTDRPRAVRISLTLEDMGTVWRTVEIRS